MDTLARPLAAASASPLAPQHPAPVQRQRLRFVAAHTHTGARSLYGSNVSLSSRDGVKVRVFYQPPSSWSQPDESLTATARTTSNTECLPEGHNFTRSVPPSFSLLVAPEVPCARIAARLFLEGEGSGSIHHIRSLCEVGSSS